MIEALNADGKALEDKSGFTFITSGERSAITNLAHEIQCRPIVLTQGLNCHWLKDKGARQCIIIIIILLLIIITEATGDPRETTYSCAPIDGPQLELRRSLTKLQ